MLSLLRIIAALLFMEHGLMKLFHFPAPQPGVPDPLPPIAGRRRLARGRSAAACSLLGLFTRPVAFLLLGPDGRGLLHGARAARASGRR